MIAPNQPISSYKFGPLANNYENKGFFFLQINILILILLHREWKKKYDDFLSDIRRGKEGEDFDRHK